MTKQQADKWIRFLRSYGPVTINEGMYAENIAKLASSYDIPELRFPHPLQAKVFDSIDPSMGVLTNLVLTGTAGDGKTWLCYRLWEKCGGDITQLNEGLSYRRLNVETPSGPATIHFIFDLSGLAPDKDQPWEPGRLNLLKQLASSLRGEGTDYFVVACNDGKLVHINQRLTCEFADESIRQMRTDFDELLATNGHELPGRRLLFLNMSGVKSAELYRLASEAILSRPEWGCFNTLAEDPAYGSASPLRKNYQILRDPLFSSRLLALFELCDANGFHIPIREMLMLLVNALLGHPKAGQHVMNANDIRRIVSTGTTALAAIHRNVFGDNLPAQKCDEMQVFNYLALFRLGQETSNEIDNLLLFGKEIPALRAHYEELISSDTLYGENPVFESLRKAYLEAEDFDLLKEEFLDELSNERRRLFFRIPDKDQDQLKLWNLTSFQSAGKYRQMLLGPLAEGKPVSVSVIEDVVRGLNRAWSGLLIDDGTHLHLTSGLDFTTSRISPIALHKVPVQRNYYLEQISIEADAAGFPVLFVYLLGEKVPYRLNLLRYEFIDRVAQGSLPNSFSRECYEDVVAFKSRVLAVWQRKTSEQPACLRIIEVDDYGRPGERTINL